MFNQIIKAKEDIEFFNNSDANTKFFRKYPPGHFYSPIPCLEEIKSREAKIFGTPPRQIPGIDLNEEGQLQILEKFKEFYNEQPFSPTKTDEFRYYFENGNYGYTDGIVLHCMIRYLQPKRIIEVGCGYSSCNMLDTNKLFFDDSIDLTFIDPNPERLYLQTKSIGYAKATVITRQVQDVSLDTFSGLEENDILFIDSSHVAKIDSDVNYLVFEVLPRLKEGVYVHFHDIWYPFEYAKEWIYDGHAWNEAYIVRAFLQYNKDFKIAFFNGYLRYFFEDVFREYMPLCLNHPGGSLWIRKVTDNRD
ncbi:MAG: class I SAM-dependent methyltransferase [Planctomycetes bacterium]|nr:class I SAM-dependent methyltransferase [Planctomycetota bacterium]